MPFFPILRGALPTLSSISSQTSHTSIWMRFQKSPFQRAKSYCSTLQVAKSTLPLNALSDITDMPSTQAQANKAWPDPEYFAHALLLRLVQLPLNCNCIHCQY